MKPGWHVRIYHVRYTVACRECGTLHDRIVRFPLSMN